MKNLFLAVAVLAAVSIYAFQTNAEKTAAKDARPVRLAPSELKWESAKALPPGAKLAVLEGDPTKAGPFTIRVKMPAEFRVGGHTHPVDERLIVVEGTFQYGEGDRYDEKALKSYPAGSYLIIPKDQPHFGASKKGTVIQIMGEGPWDIKYLAPSEDPRTQDTRR